MVSSPGNEVDQVRENERHKGVQSGHFLASHADVLRGSSRVPSAWEASHFLSSKNSYFQHEAINSINEF